MRDPKRIDEVLYQLREIWQRNPDLRLMQLLGNVFGGDPYYVEDGDLQGRLERVYGKVPTQSS